MFIVNNNDFTIFSDPVSNCYSFPTTSYDHLFIKLHGIQEIKLHGIPTSILNAVKRPSPNLDNIDITRIDKALRDRLKPFQEEGIRFVNLIKHEIKYAYCYVFFQIWHFKGWQMFNS